MGRIIPYMMENKSCLKPPTRFISNSSVYSSLMILFIILARFNRFSFPEHPGGDLPRTSWFAQPLSAMALGFVLPHLSAIHKRPEFRPAVAMGGSINGLEKCKMLQNAWSLDHRGCW
jgi:hypothetical protein